MTMASCKIPSEISALHNNNSQVTIIEPEEDYKANMLEQDEFFYIIKA